jgi:hypothetical protein
MDIAINIFCADGLWRGGEAPEMKMRGYHLIDRREA